MIQMYSFACQGKIKNYKPILVQCHISISPENVRKPMVSDVFRGYRNVTLD